MTPPRVRRLPPAPSFRILTQNRGLSPPDLEAMRGLAPRGMTPPRVRRLPPTPSLRILTQDRGLSPVDLGRMVLGMMKAG
ncbi:hypothetical protein [Planctomycetes bacterium SV_7m_r]|uniref:hypothetical protein n=1 Tax=Stieleria bergensis TaxID=2528025 RepID=UPI00119D02FC